MPEPICINHGDVTETLLRDGMFIYVCSDCGEVYETVPNDLEPYFVNRVGETSLSAPRQEA